MNTRVSSGSKNEPPVEVSFSVTPWRRLMGLFVSRKKGMSGTWCRSPFPKDSGMVPHMDGLMGLLSGWQRTALYAEWITGFAALAIGGGAAYLAWHIYHTTMHPLPGRRAPLDTDFLWLGVGTVAGLAALFVAAGVWMCGPLLVQISRGARPRQRIAMVFGSESEKLSDGQRAEPGIHASGPEINAHIPWSHVVGTSVGEAQVWIICVGRRIVDIPLHAKPLPDGRAGLITIAAKVERAARGEMTEREHLLSLMTLGGPKCPKCSYVMRGVSEQCPECGVNVVDVLGSRGQLGGGDLRLMRRLWDTDMPS